MGSVDMGNQNPWATYYTYKDCSQGICSVYCQQWCLFFPPPPPFGFDDGGDSGTDFSPLIIAVIGILASAFILVSYFTIISKYCRRRNHADSNLELNENQDVVAAEGWQGTTAGLDEVLIKSITVCKYNKGDGFVIEGSDCSVCLSEFQENESVRLLPKCNHAFHLPCIDTWLKSHASCPLCRTNIAPTSILPAAQPVSAAAAPVQETAQQNSSTNVAALEYQHRTNDGIVVVQDLEGNSFDQTIVCLDVLGEDMIPKTATQDPESLHQGLERSDHRIIEIRQDGSQPIRRSVSLHISPRESQVSIADILRISQDDEDYQTPEKSRNGIFSLVTSPLAPMKRSISTGRFMLSSGFDKGRSSVIPN